MMAASGRRCSPQPRTELMGSCRCALPLPEVTIHPAEASPVMQRDSASDDYLRGCGVD